MLKDNEKNIKKDPPEIRNVREAKEGVGAQLLNKKISNY